MEHLICKITSIRETSNLEGDWLELELSDHRGVFKPHGRLKLSLNKKSAYDFNFAISNIREEDDEKKRSTFARFKYYFQGKTVIVYVRD